MKLDFTCAGNLLEEGALGVICLLKFFLAAEDEASWLFIGLFRGRLYKLIQFDRHWLVGIRGSAASEGLFGGFEALDLGLEPLSLLAPVLRPLRQVLVIY